MFGYQFKISITLLISLNIIISYEIIISLIMNPNVNPFRNHFYRSRI